VRCGPVRATAAHGSPFILHLSSFILPVGLAVVEEHRKDRGQKGSRVVAVPVVPERHRVAQQLKPRKPVGAALVLEEQVEERGPARAKPHVKDEVRVVALTPRGDEGVLGGLGREEIELHHHRGGQVVCDKVPLSLGAGEELFEEEIMGIRDLGHGQAV